MDFVPDAPRECCRAAGNVPLVPYHPDVRPDRGLTVHVCRVCRARHFVLALPPLRVGLQGAPAGG